MVRLLLLGALLGCGEDEPPAVAGYLLRLVDEAPLAGCVPAFESPAEQPAVGFLFDAARDGFDAVRWLEPDAPGTTAGLTLAPGKTAVLVLPVEPHRVLELECATENEETSLSFSALQLEQEMPPEPEWKKLAVPMRADRNAGVLRASTRLGHRARFLAVLMQGPEGRECTIEALQVRELRGLELAQWVAQAMSREVDRAGAYPWSGRASVGTCYQELVFAPTPSTLRYRIPPTPAGQPAVLTASLGILQETEEGGSPAVEFRVLTESRAGSTLVHQEVLSWSGNDRARPPRFLRLVLGEFEDPAALVLETRSVGPENATLLAAFGQPVLRAGRSDLTPGLVVLSVDTLRADRVGALGGKPGLTPHLDRLAAESLCFEGAWAPCSYTLASHTSVFSGQYPAVHGVRVPGKCRDPRVTRLLQEHAREAGYRTAAFTGGGQIGPRLGLAGGFEIYDHADRILEGQLEPLDAWLATAVEDPFFLFLHTYAAHHYEPPRDCLEQVHPRCDSKLHGLESLRDYAVRAREPDFGDVDREHLVGVYDAAVFFADRQVGAVLDLLRRRGVLDRVPLILLSDHGEGLFEHGQVGHGFMAPFEEQVRVPLFLRPAGGIEGVGRPQLVELVDVFPTALELLQLEVLPATLQGRSLLSGMDQERTAYAESGSGREAALRSRSWSVLMQEGKDGKQRSAVFDLQVDPGEKQPLDPADPRHALALQAILERRARMRELAERLKVEAADGVLDQDIREELRALGYTELER